MTQHDQAQTPSDMAVIFRVPEWYDTLSVQCDIFGYCMLLSKIYDLKASYQEPEFSFTFTTDLFNLLNISYLALSVVYNL